MHALADGCEIPSFDTSAIVTGWRIASSQKTDSLNFSFCLIPTSPAGSSKLLVLWLQDLIAYWVQLLGSEPDQSPPSSAGVKGARCYSSSLSFVVMLWDLIWARLKFSLFIGWWFVLLLPSIEREEWWGGGGSVTIQNSTNKKGIRYSCIFVSLFIGG